MKEKKKQRRVIVVGAGASGMMAAIMAARESAAVTLLEHNDRAGKKLAQTGNGRCNITNLNMTAEAFRGEHPEFAMQVIRRFDEQKTLQFFETLGVYPKFRGDYVYPNSDQASTMVYVMLDELKRLGVEPVYGVTIEGIDYEREQGRFCVRSNRDTLYGDALILACGSKAASSTGAGDSGYVLAQSLGHRIVRVVPALTALRCVGKYYPQFAGVRTEADITLYIDHQPVAAEHGELQLTDYGISGIPVFQLSRFAAYGLLKQQPVSAIINFLPRMDFDGCYTYLKQRRQLLGEKKAQDFLLGLLNTKLAKVILKLSGISDWELSRDLSDSKLKLIAKNLTAYEAKIASTNPFANAQVCAGGVDTAELNPENMESRLVPGLYVTGELVDIDGICGGYNLQWAWSSGYMAGVHAAQV